MARRHRNKRRNPMPTIGALFLTNPRRKNKAKSKRKAPMARLFGRVANRRRNATFLLRNRKRNGVAIQTNPRRRNRLVRLKNRKFLLRRNATFLLRNRRRNGVAIQTNPRRGAHGRFIRSNRRRNGVAVQTNPHRRYNRSRRNPTFLLRNGSIPFLSPITSIVGKIPVVGKFIAPILVPALGGALIIGAVHFALTYGAPYLPEMVAPYVTPIGYTLGGAALGLAVAFVPASILSPASKASIAGIAVTVGGAVDALRYLTGDSSPMAGLGDGGLWQLGASDDASLDGDGQAMLADYSDASLADALQCDADFSQAEGQAALAGPRSWRSMFPGIRSVTRRQDGCSRHAGRHGHRWGWLIRMIGVTRFRALANMPQAQRQKFIADLKGFAVSKANEAAATAPSLSGYAGLILAQ